MEWGTHQTAIRCGKVIMSSLDLLTSLSSLSCPLCLNLMFYFSVSSTLSCLSHCLSHCLSFLCYLFHLSYLIHRSYKSCLNLIVHLFIILETIPTYQIFFYYNKTPIALPGHTLRSPSSCRGYFDVTLSTHPIY